MRSPFRAGAGPGRCASKGRGSPPWRGCSCSCARAATISLSICRGNCAAPSSRSQPARTYASASIAHGRKSAARPRASYRRKPGNIAGRAPAKAHGWRIRITSRCPRSTCTRSIAISASARCWGSTWTPRIFPSSFPPPRSPGSSRCCRATAPAGRSSNPRRSCSRRARVGKPSTGAAKVFARSRGTSWRRAARSR